MMIRSITRRFFSFKPSKVTQKRQTAPLKTLFFEKNKNFDYFKIWAKIED